MAKLLLARGAQTGGMDIAGNTPLHITSIFGHAELCRLLLRNGADLYKKGQHGALPIHIAAREGHGSLVRMMVSLYEVFSPYFGRTYRNIYNRHCMCNL